MMDAEMKALGVPVTNTPNVLSGATADMAWALLMACARRIPQCDTYCRSDQYTTYKNMLFLGSDVHHKTVGIVGLGWVAFPCVYVCVSVCLGVSLRVSLSLYVCVCVRQSVSQL